MPFKFSRLPEVLLVASTAMCAASSHADEHSIKVAMNIVNENGVVAPAGEIVITESKYGLVFTPALSGLAAGVHGFHVHENPSCDAASKDGKVVAALAAGGHWDPEGTGKHLGPFGEGHRGDLPAVYANSEGKVDYPVLAARIKTLNELRGHSLMIHVGGDNHDDHPAPLGGGGPRFVCGLIK